MALRADRRLRIPSHPVQNCNPKTGTAENPEIGDQCGGGIRWNGIDTYLPWGKHEPDAEECHINSSDTEQYIEFHKQVFSPK